MLDRWYNGFRLRLCRLSGETAVFCPRRSSIRIHDDLSVVAQVHRIDPGELRSPLLYMSYKDPKTLEEVRRSEMNQHRALGVVDDYLHVIGIGEIDFAQLLRVMRAGGVQFPNELVVDLHSRRTRGKRFVVAHPDHDGKRKAGQRAGWRFHDYAVGIEERDTAIDVDECYRHAF